METLTLAIIGHLVGDYLIQNDWMALNKKTNVLACSIHCSLWSLSVCLWAGWGAIPSLVLFGTHVLQDATPIISWYMRATGQHKFMTGPCAPWSAIVVDNVWHIVTIAAVWKFVA